MSQFANSLKKDLAREPAEIVLSAEEGKIIFAFRQKKAAEAAERARIVERLRTAYEYKKWLFENGAGSTFSTFCDDFGYEGEDHSTMFKNVTDLMQLASNL